MSSITGLTQHKHGIKGCGRKVAKEGGEAGGGESAPWWQVTILVAFPPTWLDYPPPSYGEPSSNPGGVSSGSSHTWESFRTMPLVGGFTRGFPVPPPPADSCLPRFTLVGHSQDHDPNCKLSLILPRNERVNREGEIWAAIYNEVLKADEGEIIENGATPECKDGGNGSSPRKPVDQLHRLARFPLAKIPAGTRPGIEPCSSWWEASRLTSPPLRAPEAHKDSDALSRAIELCNIVPSPSRPPSFLPSADAPEAIATAKRSSGVKWLRVRNPTIARSGHGTLEAGLTTAIVVCYGSNDLSPADNPTCKGAPRGQARQNGIKRAARTLHGQTTRFSGISLISRVHTHTHSHTLSRAEMIFVGRRRLLYHITRRPPGILGNPIFARFTCFIDGGLTRGFHWPVPCIAYKPRRMPLDVAVLPDSKKLLYTLDKMTRGNPSASTTSEMDFTWQLAKTSWSQHSHIQQTCRPGDRGGVKLNIGGSKRRETYFFLSPTYRRNGKASEKTVAGPDCVACSSPFLSCEPGPQGRRTTTAHIASLIVRYPLHLHCITKYLPFALIRLLPPHKREKMIGPHKDKPRRNSPQILPAFQRFLTPPQVRQVIKHGAQLHSTACTHARVKTERPRGSTMTIRTSRAAYLGGRGSLSATLINRSHSLPLLVPRQARLNNPLQSRASDVRSLAAAPALPHTWQHGIRFLFPCKSAIGSQSSRSCRINSDLTVKSEEVWAALNIEFSRSGEQREYGEALEYRGEGAGDPGENPPDQRQGAYVRRHVADTSPPRGWLPKRTLPTFTHGLEILASARKGEDGVGVMTELSGFPTHTTRSRGGPASSVAVVTAVLVRLQGSIDNSSTSREPAPTRCVATAQGLFCPPQYTPATISFHFTPHQTNRTGFGSSPEEKKNSPPPPLRSRRYLSRRGRGRSGIEGSIIRANQHDFLPGGVFPVDHCSLTKVVRTAMIWAQGGFCSGR
ncbi:hypothetical protein PR048_030793 [Dryococelus australis]|uniref:Uncharacterized protein n=1 Tax=Dryococelus australis TaxID=614101 RepID=A0ABQ9GDS7_9NEOP|nr:hypothetical protein PR048_030793 [Dryococelus australis]